MKNNRSQNTGTVSNATMREEDLIPAFLDCLKSQKPLQRKHSKLIREIESAMDACEDVDAEDYYASDQASEDLQDLFDALNDYAMPYFYFGAHPGDGSDYGFWVSDCLSDDFDGLKVSDTSEVPRGFSGEVLHVNDHGNMTLYAYSRGRSREVWSIV